MLCGWFFTVLYDTRHMDRVATDGMYIFCDAHFFLHSQELSQRVKASKRFLLGIVCNTCINCSWVMSINPHPIARVGFLALAMAMPDNRLVIGIPMSMILAICPVPVFAFVRYNACNSVRRLYSAFRRCRRVCGDPGGVFGAFRNNAPGLQSKFVGMSSQDLNPCSKRHAFCCSFS